VLLASPRTPVEVNWEVIDLLKTAGRQAASILAQMQATEALLESRKFEAFSRMSAFVVHDLKNIVAQLSLMVKNAKRLQNNPEFQADMLMTVENSLERMRQLMLQLREGASWRSRRGRGPGKIAERLAANALRRGRWLKWTFRHRFYPWTRRSFGAHHRPSGSKRAGGHRCHRPCLDSGRSPWQPCTRRSRRRGPWHERRICPDAVVQAFQTTKEAGMGIGTYESFQYVQELGASSPWTARSARERWWGCCCH
jgi:hypothetical protein